MLVATTYSDTSDHEDSGITWSEGSIFELLKCPACAALTLRSYYWHDGYMDPGDTVTYQTLYPSERVRPRGLPEPLANDYEAAQRVKEYFP
jgi:hypothetical protein